LTLLKYAPLQTHYYDKYTFGIARLCLWNDLPLESGSQTCHTFDSNCHCILGPQQV